ncbi:hypothetical protein GIB67_041458, partial [Kingdonia uniflora]
SINITHTRGELDQNLTTRLLDRPFRPNRAHSSNLKAAAWIQPAQLYIQYSKMSQYDRLLIRSIRPVTETYNIVVQINSLS